MQPQYTQLKPDYPITCQIAITGYCTYIPAEHTSIAVLASLGRPGGRVTNSFRPNGAHQSVQWHQLSVHHTDEPQ